jgi:cell division protein FtsB
MLSGVTKYFGVGSPGLIQYVQMSTLLHERQTESQETDVEIARLDSESALLEKSSTVLEHEIRKTMGYVGENEMIFDFSLSSSAALRR